jgi:hypothetical protein
MNVVSKNLKNHWWYLLGNATQEIGAKVETKVDAEFNITSMKAITMARSWLFAWNSKRYFGVIQSDQWIAPDTAAWWIWCGGGRCLKLKEAIEYQRLTVVLVQWGDFVLFLAKWRPNRPLGLKRY